MTKRFITLIIVGLVLVTSTMFYGYAEKTQVDTNVIISNATTIFNGELIKFMEKGEEVFPIIHKGTLYVPLLSLSEQVGLKTFWDRSSATITIGSSFNGLDFIEKFNSYSGKNTSRSRKENKKELEIAGIKLTSWIEMEGGIRDAFDEFNIGGTFHTFQFRAYSDGDAHLIFYGDDDVVLQEFLIIGQMYPQIFSLDVSNVKRLKIHQPLGIKLYLFDVRIQ